MINIFYRPEMVATSNISSSPSAGKPKEVVEDWLTNKNTAPFMQINGNFPPVTIEQICSVHDSRFVESILNCKIPNGFGNKNAEVAASLPFTSGSFLAAAEYALANKTAAASPTSGFHHVSPYVAEGFCTFNGLMIAAVALLNKVSKIVILDFDMHYGNGTDNIIANSNLHHSVVNVTNDTYWRSAKDVLSFCNINNLTNFLTEQKADIVFYQAGADIHVKDPFGGILTTEEMIERDKNIFESCYSLELPIVWNLAGGYQKDNSGSIAPIINLHRNTMMECIKVYG